MATSAPSTSGVCSRETIADADSSSSFLISTSITSPGLNRSAALVRRVHVNPSLVRSAWYLPMMRRAELAAGALPPPMEATMAGTMSPTRIGRCHRSSLKLSIVFPCSITLRLSRRYPRSLSRRRSPFCRAWLATCCSVGSRVVVTDRPLSYSAFAPYCRSRYFRISSMKNGAMDWGCFG